MACVPTSEFDTEPVSANSEVDDHPVPSFYIHAWYKPKQTIQVKHL